VRYLGEVSRIGLRSAYAGERAWRRSFLVELMVDTKSGTSFPMSQLDESTYLASLRDRRSSNGTLN
jgi:hypothetical protein